MTREKAGKTNFALIIQLGSLWNTSSLGKNRTNQLKWAISTEQSSWVLQSFFRASWFSLPGLLGEFVISSLQISPNCQITFRVLLMASFSAASTICVAVTSDGMKSFPNQFLPVGRLFNPGRTGYRWNCAAQQIQGLRSPVCCYGSEDCIHAWVMDIVPRGHLLGN